MKGHYVYVSSRARAWSSAGITDNDLFIVTARVSGIATTIIVLLTAIVLNRMGRQLLILTNSGGMVVAISIFPTDS